MKNLIVWLDDERPMPEGFNYHASKIEELYHHLRGGEIDHISFDHDLGENNKTGYDLACLIEELAFQKAMPKISWDVHSQNPIGADKIRAAMENATYLWSRG